MPEHHQMQQSKKSDTNFQKPATSVSQTPVSSPYSIIQRAKISPKSLTRADIMQLQRTIGNQAVGRLLSSIGSSPTAHEVPIQRSEIPEEEEKPVQGKFETVQRSEIPEEEEPLQGKMVRTIQRQEILEEEEPLQGKMIETVQRQDIPEEEEPLQTKMENNTGMPDNLKAGVENLSGINMSNVRVHYNSSKPAEVGALAYTQGTNIHVAPGQERHLPHEAWHVVQQAQGRVRPTFQMKGVAVNDNEVLEREADVMGMKASKMRLPDKIVTNPIGQAKCPKSSLYSGRQYFLSYIAEKKGIHNSCSCAPLLQKMVVAVGDLAELTHGGRQLTQEQQSSANIITEAVTKRVNHTRERQANPWDERFWPFSSGPLAKIGNEDLRIYGHGEKIRGRNFVSSVGGYTAENLANKLIKMGLPKEYSNEIYLTGCETALGDNFGYLGAFYNFIVKHCPRVKVRGNIAVSTTFEDGTQGVWTGVFPSEQDFKQMLRLLAIEAGRINQDISSRNEAAKNEQDPAVRAQLIKDLQRDIPLAKKEMQGHLDHRERLMRTAYSTDPAYTRVLPP